MKYFPFNELNDQVTHLEDLFLFFVIVYLIYNWIRLFLYFDKT